MLQIHICKRQRNLIFWAILTSNEKAIDKNVSKEKKKQERRAKQKTPSLLFLSLLFQITSTCLTFMDKISHDYISLVRKKDLFVLVETNLSRVINISSGDK